MGYILHKGKVMQISEDRKYKGYNRGILMRDRNIVHLFVMKHIKG